MKIFEVEPYFEKSYLAMIRNSVGSKMFRNAFAKVNGKDSDLTRDGKDSCGYFVSSILLIHRLIKEFHVTVAGTIRDMEKNGWYKIDEPKIGAVLSWEPEKFDDSWYDENGHLGFFIGDNKVISSGRKSRLIESHHWTYNGKRKVEAIYWHKKLDKK